VWYLLAAGYQSQFDVKGENVLTKIAFTIFKKRKLNIASVSNYNRTRLQRAELQLIGLCCVPLVPNKNGNCTFVKYYGR